MLLASQVYSCEKRVNLKASSRSPKKKNSARNFF